MIFSEFLHEMSDALFPPLCIACTEVLSREDEKVFCGRCSEQISYIAESRCPICGITFPDSPAGDHVCGSCLETRPLYTFARAAVSYDGVVHDAILQFKYGRNITKGEALANLLSDFNFPDVDWQSFDLIIPVPLHVRRLRSRGFNQSLILARALGKKHHLPVNFSLLKRRKMTQTQTGLDKKEREKNIKGAFEVPVPENIADKNIVLVDDVLTTGSTANECAKILKKAGAAHVAVITLARVL